MKALLNKLNELRCLLFHDEITRAVHGKYHCMTCLRTYDAPFH